MSSGGVPSENLPVVTNLGTSVVPGTPSLMVERSNNLLVVLFMTQQSFHSMDKLDPTRR